MKNQNLFLPLLIGLDVATKIAAVALLPADAPAAPESLFHLELALNPSGLGTGARALIAGRSVVLIGGAAGCWIFAFILLALRHRQRLQPRWILGALAAAIPAAWLIATVMPAISAEGSVMLLRLGQRVLWCVVWWVTRATLWKTGASLFAAAAVGNTLSLFYPPYQVVDFIWSAPVHRVVGLHVFNLADAMWLAGCGVFVAALLDGLARRLVARLRRRTVDGRR